MALTIADYTFTSSVDTLPTFNSGYVYTYTDTVNSDGTTRRVITSEEYPSYISFNGCGELLRVDKLAITNKVTSMYSSFNECRKLSYINTTNWNTSNVTNMDSLFRNCTSLTTLDVSSFNTSNVTNMSAIFNGNISLTKIDLFKWNTSKVTDMSNMFSNCKKLTSLDISNFDTSNVINMSYMFNNCESLTMLDISNFNTSKVTIMSAMFYNCNKLTILDASNFDTGKVINMSSMFSECTSLTILDVSKWNTNKVTNMSYAFSNCNKLTTLDVSNFDTGNVTNMRAMFYKCVKLTILDVSKWNTSGVIDISYIFWNCNLLTTLDVSKWNTNNITDMSNMFSNCISLTTLNVSNFDTSKVINMDNMFWGCSILDTLDISNFNMKNVTNQNNMFYNCSRLTNMGILYSNASTVNKVLSILPTNNTEDINVWVEDAKTSECTIPSGAKIKVKKANIEKTEILINEPLRGLPNGVKDRFVHQNGKWYIERNTNKTIINENTEVSKHTGYRYRVVISEQNDKYSIKFRSIYLSDKFKVDLEKMSNENYTLSYCNSGDDCGHPGKYIIYLRLDDNDDNWNVAYLKSWLKNNPITVIYQLETPIYEEIADPVLNTYLDNTYIKSNNIIPVDMQVLNHGVNVKGMAPNSVYTLVSNISGSSNTSGAILGGKEQTLASTLTTDSTLNDNLLRLYGKGLTYKNNMLFDGIEKNYDGYFEGMRSSYDEIGVNNIYPVKVKVHGKNLWKWNYQNDFDIQVINNIDLKKGVYCISCNRCSNKLIAFGFRDENNKVITSTYINSSFELSKSAKSIAIYSTDFSYSNSLGKFANISDIQLEQGTQYTSYEPYWEEEITVNLNSPLLQDDELVFRDNGIYHIHNSEIVDDNINKLTESIEELICGAQTLTPDNTNGYVDKVYLETESFVPVTSIETKYFKEEMTYLYANTNYYITFNCNKNSKACVELGGASKYFDLIEGENTLIMKTPSVLQNSRLVIYGQNVDISDIIVSNKKARKYFTGMKSTFERNEIDTDIDNSNLCLALNIYDTNTAKWNLLTDDYDISSNTLFVSPSYYDANTGGLNLMSDSYDSYTKDLNLLESEYNIDTKNLSINNKSNIVKIRSHNEDGTKEDAKKIKLIEPLRGLMNGVCDRIVKKANGWYIERNCGKYTFTGYENWKGYTLDNSEIYKKYRLSLDSLNINCDSIDLKTLSYMSYPLKSIPNIDCKELSEHIELDKTCVSIQSSVLDTTEFKQWLKDNPTTIIYQLADPTYERVNDLILQAYKDGYIDINDDDIAVKKFLIELLYY